MKTLKKIYLYFLIFTLIYIEFGYKVVVEYYLSGTERMLILLIVTAPLLLTIKRKEAPPFILFVCLAFLIGFNSLRGSALKDCILLLIPIYIGFIIATNIKIKQFAEVFLDVMLFLAVYSLGIFALCIISPTLMQKFPLIGYRFGVLQVHDAIFAVGLPTANQIRNYGITWEPGAFAVLLCIALYINFFIEKDVKFTNVTVLVVTILTTFSTMGYFVMGGILLSVMFQRRVLSKKMSLAIPVLIAACAVTILLLPQEAMDLVFSKLEGLFSSDGELVETTQARLDAIVYPFKAFLSSPVVGIGYESFSYLNKEFCNGVATNTILNWFACMGLLLGLPCFYYYMNFIYQTAKYMRLSWFSTIVLFISFILLVSTESLLRISLIYILIFYGTQKNLFKEKELSYENLVRTWSL